MDLEGVVHNGVIVPDKSDLAAVRDRSAFQQMAPAEKEAARRFWADVESVASMFSAQSGR